MQIDHYLVWYNGMGGSPIVSFVGDYLLTGSQKPNPVDFERIEIYAHVPSEHVDTQLSELAERFTERTLALPKCWIKRNKRLIELAYNSKLGFAEDLTGNRQTPQIAEFRLACSETIGILRQMRGKIVESQTESFDNMLNEFALQETAIPDTQDRFAEMFAQLRRDAESRLAP